MNDCTFSFQRTRPADLFAPTAEVVHASTYSYHTANVRLYGRKNVPYIPLPSLTFPDMQVAEIDLSGDAVREQTRQALEGMLNTVFPRYCPRMENDIQHTAGQRTCENATFVTDRPNMLEVYGADNVDEWVRRVVDAAFFLQAAGYEKLSLTYQRSSLHRLTADAYNPVTVSKWRSVLEFGTGTDVRKSKVCSLVADGFRVPAAAQVDSPERWRAHTSSVAHILRTLGFPAGEFEVCAAHEIVDEAFAANDLFNEAYDIFTAVPADAEAQSKMLEAKQAWKLRGYAMPAWMMRSVLLFLLNRCGFATAEVGVKLRFDTAAPYGYLLVYPIKLAVDGSSSNGTGVLFRIWQPNDQRTVHYDAVTGERLPDSVPFGDWRLEHGLLDYKFNPATGQPLDANTPDPSFLNATAFDTSRAMAAKRKHQTA